MYSVTFYCEKENNKWYAFYNAVLSFVPHVGMTIRNTEEDSLNHRVLQVEYDIGKNDFWIFVEKD